MEQLSFEEKDLYLLSQQDSKIIHQVWFGIIPNKREASKQLKKLKKYQDSWIINNPTWVYKCWDYDECKKFVKTFYPEHLEMYNNYPYHIQRCDCIRYMILHRYGGLYADMDYCCVKTWEIVLTKYNKEIYLTETPNKINNEIHISNSLMYSVKNHPYWISVLIEMQKNINTPKYYSRHMTIMYTTGPGIINRVFQKYKLRYKLGFYPYQYFHPFGLDTDLDKKESDIYAYHLGKGSWESSDSKIIIFLYKEFKILIIILSLFVILFFLRK